MKYGELTIRDLATHCDKRVTCSVNKDFEDSKYDCPMLELCRAIKSGLPSFWLRNPVIDKEIDI